MNNEIQTKSLSYQLSTDEFWLLLSQHGPAFVIGMENPHLGWLAEEIEAANRQAVDSLLARGLARPMTDETVDVDDDLLAMAEACVQCRHTLILQISNGADQSQQRMIHLADNLTVEHVESEPGKHTLTALPTSESVMERMTDALRLNTPTSGRGKTFQMPEETLYQAVELVSKQNLSDAVDVLKNAELSQSDTQALIAVLSAPVANASLVVIANQNDPDAQHIRGFGVLEGSDDLWIMQPRDHMGQPRVEFIPTDAAGIRRRLEEVLPA